MRPPLFKTSYSGKALLIATTLLICFLSGIKAFCAPPDKIQQAVDAIKQAYYCEDDDYHTDGKRTVWVKSYKKWRPEDWTTVQKEAPDVIRFLKQAIAHNRPDVLQQLMPEYYRSHGGIAAYEWDIEKK